MMTKHVTLIERVGNLLSLLNMLKMTKFIILPFKLYMLSFTVNSCAANFGWTLLFLPTTACEGSYDGW